MELDITQKNERRNLIREAGVTQRQLAKYLGKYPQQVHDATNGFQPALWDKIVSVLSSPSLLKKVKKV